MKEKHRKVQVNTRGLVARYKLWAGATTGSVVLDYSVNDFTGTLTGTAIALAYPGLSFFETADFIDIGAGPTSVKSVAIWINPESIEDDNYPIGLNGTDFISVISGAVTVNGFTAAKLYVDGVLGTSGVTTIAAGTWSFIVVTDTTASNATDFDIGQATDLSFEGSIGESLLFDRVLPAAEVKSIYDLTKWRYV